MRIQERLRYWEGDGHPHGLLHREAAALLDEAERVVEGLLDSFDDTPSAESARAFLAKLKEQDNGND